MPNLLIRDVPVEVVAAIDLAAQAQGISRTEYLRRTLARERRLLKPLRVEDLQKFSDLCGDLENPEVMDQAWS